MITTLVSDKLLLYPNWTTWKRALRTLTDTIPDFPLNLTIHVTFPPPTNTSAPRGLAAAPLARAKNSKKIQVSWNCETAEEDDVIGYEIQRRTNQQGDWVKINSQLVEVSSKRWHFEMVYINNLGYDIVTSRTGGQGKIKSKPPQHSLFSYRQLSLSTAKLLLAWSTITALLLGMTMTPLSHHRHLHQSNSNAKETRNQRTPTVSCHFVRIHSVFLPLLPTVSCAFVCFPLLPTVSCPFICFLCFQLLPFCTPSFSANCELLF